MTGALNGDDDHVITDKLLPSWGPEGNNMPVVRDQVRAMVKHAIAMQAASEAAAVEKASALAEAAENGGGRSSRSTQTGSCESWSKTSSC